MTFNDRHHKVNPYADRALYNKGKYCRACQIRFPMVFRRCTNCMNLLAWKPRVERLREKRVHRY